MTLKSDRRRSMKKVLGEIKNKDQQSKVIVNQILDFLNQHEFKSLGLYLPLEDEVNIHQLLQSEEIVNKYQIFLPRWVEKAKPLKEMNYYLFEGEESIEEIEVFNQKMKQVKSTRQGKPELILVPGLAFTKNGERLGRGKGYYDKYLAQNNCYRAGICFKEQIVLEIPIDKHDQKLDYVFSIDINNN